MTAKHPYIQANSALPEATKAALEGRFREESGSATGRETRETEERDGIGALEISFNGKSIEGEKREIEAGILSETRRRILELALRIEQGRITEEILEETRESLAKISEEIGKRKDKDILFNYPIFDQVGRIVFEDLLLTFGKDAQVKEALRVIMTVFGQRYNAVFVVDAEGRALGIAPTALLINSLPEDRLGDIPIIGKDFAITLESKPSEVRATMARLGVNVLPVVDKKGFVIGAFTARDHVKGETALFSSKLKANIQTHARIESVQKDLEAPAA